MCRWRGTDGQSGRGSLRGRLVEREVVVQLQGLEQGKSGPEEGLQQFARNVSRKVLPKFISNEKLQGLKPLNGESIHLSLD